MRDDCCCRGGRLPVSPGVRKKKGKCLCGCCPGESDISTLLLSLTPNNLYYLSPSLLWRGRTRIVQIPKEWFAIGVTGQTGGWVRALGSVSLWNDSWQVTLLFQEGPVLLTDVRGWSDTMALLPPQIGKANRASLIRDLQHQCWKRALAPQPLQKAPWEFSKRVLSLGSKQPKLSCHWHPLDKCLCSRIKHKTLD